MQGKIKDLTFGRDGEQYITLASKEDMRNLADELNGTEVDFTIKKYRKKRSLDANSYMWVLCTKISEKTGISKDEIYRLNIKEGNQYTPLPIREDAVEEFSQIWSTHGTGWFTEIKDNSKLEGYKLVFAYHGSSTYDTKQMSDLIDRVVQDAKAQGIETMTPQELQALTEAWNGR